MEREDIKQRILLKLNTYFRYISIYICIILKIYSLVYSGSIYLSLKNLDEKTSAFDASQFMHEVLEVLNF